MRHIISNHVHKGREKHKCVETTEFWYERDISLFLKSGWGGEGTQQLEKPKCQILKFQESPSVHFLDTVSNFD